MKKRKTRRPARPSFPSLPSWQSLGRRGHFIVGGIALLFVLGLAAMFTGTQLENQNSFCASCHTEGEQTFYNQSLASAPVDLASFHELKGSARCIDCHTGQGVPGRFFGLIAGASDLVSFYSGHYPQPAVQDTPLPDENCLKCHANITQKQDMTNHFHVFLTQWQGVDPNAARCVSCHNGHNVNGDSKIAFLNQTDTEAICQKCHTAIGGGG
jgi:predicted CXXCH cytochrome family protein